jgi:hypothetical protein
MLAERKRGTNLSLFGCRIPSVHFQIVELLQEELCPQWPDR